MADALDRKRRFNGLDLAFALRQGVERSYRAVSQPIEGTILTVIRDAAEAAVAAAERDPDIETVLAATVDAAEKSVARTPTLLPILREAGVVDSGGQGLFRLFQGALQQLVGEGSTTAGKPASSAKLSMLVAHADDGHGYETVFFVRPLKRRKLDLDAIRDRLGALGESVIVAGDHGEAKVHVHNERPDEILAYGLSLGALSDITVVNLDHQTAEVRGKRVGELTDGAGKPGSGAAHGKASPAVETIAPPASIWVDPRALNGATMPFAVVAVATGEGLEKEFRDRGAAAIVRGGQTSNPSAGELLAAVQRVNALEVVILPNNRNVVLAARQVVGLATRPVHVVPTRNAVEGLEAILAVNLAADVATNVQRMTEHGRDVRTLQVTTAVRDARIGPRKVRKGQTIVLDPDEGLVAADKELGKAVLAALATLKGAEAVTLLYGEGASLAEAEALAARVKEAFPHVEADVGHGGQPLYPYLIAVW
jgi:DAK2 domain fusion protein YloV